MAFADILNPTGIPQTSLYGLSGTNLYFGPSKVTSNPSILMVAQSDIFSSAKAYYSVTLDANYMYSFYIVGTPAPGETLIFDGSMNPVIQNSESNDGSSSSSLDIVESYIPQQSGIFYIKPNWLTNSGSVIVYKFAVPDTTTAPTISNGTNGNDMLIGRAFNETINGGAGTDTLILSGHLSDCTITKTPTGFTMSGAGNGTDTLSNIERLQFDDLTVNLTVQANAASITTPQLQRLAELYVAFFNRVPEADGLSYWIDVLKAGYTFNQIAEAFYNAGVQYEDLTGYSPTMSHEDFVNVIYKNVLGRPDGADAEGLAFWSNALADGIASHGSLVSAILDSAHTYKGDPTWGWVADLLDNKIEVAEKFAVEWGLGYNTPEDSIANGMAIAAAVTPFSTNAAIALIGIPEGQISLG